MRRELVLAEAASHPRWRPPLLSARRPWQVGSRTPTLRWTVAVGVLAMAGTAFRANAQPCPPGPMPLAALPVDPGEVVVTCCSGIIGGPGPNAVLDLDGFVVGLIDARQPPLGQPPVGCEAGPLGTVNWRPRMFHNEDINPLDPSIWNARNLGQVFGLALDDAAAPNIYVTASTIYGEFINPPTFGPGGSGAVYQLSGTTGAICTLASLPNPSGVGLGNVAFSPVGNYLYISNMEDGLIYVVPTSPCPQPPGTIYLTYDHGVTGRSDAGLPLIPDNPTARYTQLGRRVWGVAVNESERRLYYSVWWEHRGPNGGGIVNTTEDNEVWSVQLTPTGGFVPNSARREFRHPPFFGLPITGWSNPASDLSFTPAGKLMLAERTRTADSGQRLVNTSPTAFDAHQSRVLEFTGAHLTWSASPTNKYRVGHVVGSPAHENAAGGVVADCDENVWASGDALHWPAPYIYGIQRIPNGGNIGVTPPTRDSFLIDLDDDTSSDQVKTEFGDVAIRNACADLCDRDSIQLNTGFEHTLGGGMVYPIGSLDAFYELLTDPDPGTTEPRPAGVINKHRAWANPDPNSQWLGAYPGAIAPLNGFYVFQTCFCLQEGFHDVEVRLGARADDAVNVYLNETLADVLSGAATPIHIGDHFSAPVLNFTTFTNQSRLVVGRNCLMFRVENIGAVAMGLNGVVTVTAPGFLAVDPTCCSNGSTISGQKWNDLNGDGIRQGGEPILPNWTINLSNGASVMTDSNGFYYFTHLDPGAYTVTETQQPGWQQTFPAGGAGHMIDLGMNQAVGGFDFGNVFRPCATFTDVSILCEVAGIPPVPTGNFVYTFTFTNNTSPPQPIQYLFTPQNSGVTFNGSPPPGHSLALASPVPPGGISPPITVTISGQSPGNEFCFDMTFANPDIEVCCEVDDHCITLPECDCEQFPMCNVTCGPGIGSYTLDFTVQNLFTGPINELHIFPLPNGSGVNASPADFYFASVSPGGIAGPFTTIISGAMPGELCLRISVHLDGQQCCSEVKCITIPSCLVCGFDPCDTNCDGVVDAFDIESFIDLLLSPNPMPCSACAGDVNGDGVIDAFDIEPFIGCLLGP